MNAVKVTKRKEKQGPTAHRREEAMHAAAVMDDKQPGLPGAPGQRSTPHNILHAAHTVLCYDLSLLHTWEESFPVLHSGEAEAGGSQVCAQPGKLILSQTPPETPSQNKT